MTSPAPAVRFAGAIPRVRLPTAWWSTVLLVVLLSLVLRETMHAQPARERVPAARRGPDFTTTEFGRNAGLLSSTVYSATRDAEGRLWLGTEDGPFVSAGGQWHAEQLPPSPALRQTRDILFDHTGARWLAMRSGAFRFADGQWTRFSVDEGVPGPVVFKLAETRAVDGAPRVVLGAMQGVCVIEATRCRALALPKGVGPTGFIVRSLTSRDDRDELWVASSDGGVARLLAGQWTAFTRERGLSSGGIEDLAVAPTANGQTVFAAGAAGVFRTVRAPNGEIRFDSIRGAPTSAYRVEWVPKGTDDGELWVGTTTGIVARWRATGWDTLAVNEGRIRGQITMMQAMTDANETRAVYLGSRGSHLSRINVTPAVAFVLPERAARDLVHSIANTPGSGALGDALVSTLGAGTVRIDTLAQLRTIGRASDPLLASTTGAYWGPLRPGVTDRAVAGDTAAVIVLTSRGPAIPGPRGFVLMPIPDSVVFRQVRRVPVLRGGSAVLGATQQGVYRWTGARWEAEVGVPTLDATDVFGAVIGGDTTLFVMSRGGVHTLTARRARFDSVIASDNRAGTWMRAMCTVPRRSGNLLFVVGDRGAIMWRHHERDERWRLAPSAIRDAMDPLARVRIACDTGGRVLFGSGNGLTVADVSDDDPERWRVLGVVGSEDGLPSSSVTAVGVPFGDRVWVGTEFGPAIVDLKRITLAPLVPISLRVLDDPAGVSLTNGTVLPASHDQLRVDVWLNTYHREDESRYLVEFERISSWGRATRRSAASTDTVWSGVGTRFITGIEPGLYRLRVRARDFAGREAAPVEWQLRIRPPWWATWFAIVGYVVLGAGLLFGVYRWRVSVLTRGTAQLVESERRLRESEGKFRALFDRALDAHLLVEHGRIMGANSVAATLFGTSDRVELVGRALGDFLPSSAIPAATPLPQELMITRGERRVPVQLTVTPISIDRSVMMHHVLRDLTEVRAAERERERMESHLRERQRLEALGTLAGGVAHDFNNLIGVIRGNAELADQVPLDDATRHEHLSSIVDASDRARDLVRQILAFSRSPLPRQERVDLSELLRGLQPLLRRMIPSSVAIELQGADTPHVIEGDPTQLQQIVINLASNAEHAMRSRATGSLVMSLRAIEHADDAPPPHGRIVQLTVSDNGVGMSDAIRERVFEPFFTTKPTGEGSGLGLAVLHGVVLSHGGRVTLQSTPEEGTVVEISFPACPAGASVAPSALVAPSPTARRGTVGARLVIVDDEPAVAQVLDRALSRSGYLVRVFSKPDAALSEILRAPDAVDLLLTDQTMPGLTGDMLSEAVHAAIPTLPILILTGFSHRLTPERAAAVGATAVLEKPISLDALHEAVASALGRVDPVAGHESLPV